MQLDHIIKQAVEQYQENWVRELPSEQELGKKYRLTKEFRRKMEKLIQKEKRPFYRMFNTAGKRVAVILTTFLVAAAALCMSVEAIRTPIVRFFVETFEKYSIITTTGEGSEAGKTRIEREYELGELPQGYELVESQTSELAAIKEYRNGENGLLLLDQSPWTVIEDMADTESARTEEVEVSGNPGTYIEKNGRVNLVWAQEGYRFLLTAEGIGKEELMRLAETLRPIEE